MDSFNVQLNLLDSYPSYVQYPQSSIESIIAAIKNVQLMAGKFINGIYIERYDFGGGEKSNERIIIFKNTLRCSKFIGVSNWYLLTNIFTFESFSSI